MSPEFVIRVNLFQTVVFLAQVALLPATWCGLYALAFGLIALAWSGKSLYNIIAGPKQLRQLARKPDAGSSGTLGSDASQETQSTRLTDSKQEAV